MQGPDLRMTTSDDVELGYSDEGEGSPVVLLHGYSCTRWHWEYQREALLSAGYRVVMLDFRGHGDSEAPLHGQTLARLGQDTRELLTLLDLQDVTLLCHSMGASVAFAMSTISGFDRIKRFVIVDQTPKIINDDTWGWGVRGVTWDNFQDCIHFRIKWSNEDQEPALPTESRMAQEPWELFDHEAVRGIFTDHFVADWRGSLHRITVPTWVVTSEHTNYYHREGMEWLANEVANGTLSVFKHSGHNPHVTEPDEFNRQLMDFIQSND
jgi:non-heme chloroperoxidase